MNKVFALLAALLLVASAPARAAERDHAAPAQPADAAHAAQPQDDHAAADDHAAEGGHGLWSGLLWPTANFLILAGTLWWLLKTPLANYLRDRHTSIRSELVDAAKVKAEAASQLAEIDRKLEALPGEIEALRDRGSREIAAEEQRIAQAAAAERERLLEQTRREIDLQLRLARRALVEHTADLAVQLAGDRLRRDISPDEQSRLVDRYLAQVDDATRDARR